MNTKILYTSLVIAFSFFFTNCGYTQNKLSVSGKVTERRGKSLSNVNITLVKYSDSSTVAREVSTTKGRYNFSGVIAGQYFLKASYVGFEKKNTAVFTLDKNQLNAVIDIQMKDANQLQLSEVQISTKKSLFSNSMDRKVYNVGMDLIVKSGSASEVLQNVPLVQVDIDGNVSLRNSAVTILINGKISPIMGKNASAALQQMPAGSIERIEVITNPSAKYKPDGTGGIINIVLKKDIKQGLNGTLNANIGNRNRYNANASLNYHPGKLNVFGSFAIRQDDRLRATINDRIQTDSFSGQTNQYHDNLSSASRPFAYTTTVGFEFSADSNNSFGISANYSLRKMTKNDLTSKSVSSGGNLIQDYLRKRFDPEREKNLNGNIFYEHLFGRDNHKIRAEFTISHSPEIEDNHYINTYHLPAINDQLDNTLIKQISDDKNLNVGYENAISESLKLEVGYDGQYNRQDLDFYGEGFSYITQQFVKDVNKTNRFIYNENVHAVYTTLAKELKKLSLMLGLRGEYSDITSKLITTNMVVPNHYFKIYPTMHISYKLSDDKEIQLNYSRRVRRPEGDDLNPFAEYADPTNVRVGNPFLLPEIIHSVETGLLYRKRGISILPGLYYRYTYNRFTSITSPLNDSVLVTRQQNLANDQAIGADVVFSGNLGKKTTMSLTPNVFYNQIDASNLGYGTKKSTIAWSASLNSTYAIAAGTTAQINSNYKSARLTPQGKYLPSFVMNMGIRQDLFGKKASAYFTASDVFKSQRQEANLQGPFLTQHVLTKSNSRIFYVGLSYNFGVDKKKKDLQFDNSL
ncbi:outer membrane receptor protein involved in Fe transport [Pedobacter sp. UYP24]